MSRKAIVLIAILTLFTFSLTGCGLLDKMLSIKEDFKKEDETPNVNQQGQLGEIVVDTPDMSELVINEQITEFRVVQLYFGAPDGEHLVTVEKEIPKAEGIARATISSLLEGPDFQSGLLPTIPAGTNLLDINVKEDGLCIVDFSSELVSNLTGGEIGEKLAVYSITNTLCQFPTIDRVEFRIEGQNVDTLLGYMQLEPTVAANASITQQN